jgi:hypothetical protein
MSILKTTSIFLYEDVYYNKDRDGNMLIVKLDEDGDVIYKLSGVDHEIFSILTKVNKVTFANLIRQLDGKFDFDGTPLETYLNILLKDLEKKGIVILGT